MEVIHEESLISSLFDHPYETSLDYHAGMSVVYLSSDKKLLIGYWHAPQGEVEINYGVNIEFNYIISGRIRVTTSDGCELTALAGDILKCGGNQEKVIYHIEEYAKTLFIVYPQSEADWQTVCEMVRSKEPLKFKPNC